MVVRCYVGAGIWTWDFWKINLTAAPPLQHLRCYFKWKHFPNSLSDCSLHMNREKLHFHILISFQETLWDFFISSSSCFTDSLVCFMHKIISTVHRVTCSLWKNIPPFFPFPFLLTSARIPRTIKTINGRSVLIFHIRYGARCRVFINVLLCVECLCFLQIHRLKNESFRQMN